MFKQLKINARLFFATVVLFTLVCSSNNRIAGGTSIPNQVVGTIFTPGGKPAGGAHVTLMSEDTNEYHFSSIYDSTLSNRDGEYCFVNVKAGNYAIVATIPDSMFVIKRSGISVSDDKATVSTGDTMVPGGSISGNVRINGADSTMFLLLSNTPYVATVNKYGDFHFTAVPSGSYLLLTVLKNGYRNQPVLVHTDSVRVSTGSITVVDTIIAIPLFLTAGLHSLDNFDDGNAINSQECYWWAFNDASSGGSSKVTPPLESDFTQAIEANGADSTPFCCHIKYNLGNTSPCFAGMGCELASQYNGMLQARDLSRMKSMNVWLKSKGTVSLVFIPGSNSVENVTLCTINSSSDIWKRITINIDSVLASGDTAFTRIWEKTKQNIVQFDIIGTGDGGSSGEFWIDNIEFEFR
jgi:hypothetical protein